MKQMQLGYPPLTFNELSDLLSRHIENPAVAKVIKDAMQRRLSEVPDEGASAEVSQV